MTEISLNELSDKELREYEQMLFDQILDLKYAEDGLSEIQGQFKSVQHCVTNVFNEVPASFPSGDVEATLDEVNQKRVELEEKHAAVEEEINERDL